MTVLRALMTATEHAVALLVAVAASGLRFALLDRAHHREGAHEAKHGACPVVVDLKPSNFVTWRCGRSTTPPRRRRGCGRHARPDRDPRPGLRAGGHGRLQRGALAWPSASAFVHSAARLLVRAAPSRSAGAGATWHVADAEQIAAADVERSLDEERCDGSVRRQPRGSNAPTTRRPRRRARRRPRVRLQPQQERVVPPRASRRAAAAAPAAAAAAESTPRAGAAPPRGWADGERSPPRARRRPRAARARACEVFFSFRVAEALARKKRLAAACEARGAATFVCEAMIENSADWVATITRRLQECRVFVAMVSPTYGAPGREVLGTCEEFNAALRRRNAYGRPALVVVRLPELAAWPPATDLELVLGNLNFTEWRAPPPPRKPGGAPTSPGKRRRPRRPPRPSRRRRRRRGGGADRRRPPPRASSRRGRHTETRRVHRRARPACCLRPRQRASIGHLLPLAFAPNRPAPAHPPAPAARPHGRARAHPPSPPPPPPFFGTFLNAPAASLPAQNTTTSARCAILSGPGSSSCAPGRARGSRSGATAAPGSGPSRVTASSVTLNWREEAHDEPRAARIARARVVARDHRELRGLVVLPSVSMCCIVMSGSWSASMKSAAPSGGRRT